MLKIFVFLYFFYFVALITRLSLQILLYNKKHFVFGLKTILVKIFMLNF